MRKKIIYLLLVLCLQNIINAQSSQKIDELRKEYSKCLSDTQKVNIMVSISMNYLQDDLNLDSTEFYAKKALVVAQKLNFKRGLSRCNRSLGFLHEQRSDLIKALEYFNEALRVDKEAGYRLRMKDDYIFLGDCYRGNEMFSKAIESFESGLTLSKEIKDKKGIAQCLVALGRMFVNQGERAQGVENFENALKIYMELKDSTQILEMKRLFAQHYGEQKNLSRAIENFTVILDYFLAKNDSQRIRNTYNEIGLIYDFNEDYVNAIKNYEKSLSYSYHLGDPSWLRGSLGNIAGIYIKKGDLVKATQYGEQSLQAAKETGDSSQLAWAYLRLSEICRKQKNFKKAKNYIGRTLDIFKKDPNYVESVRDIELEISKVDSALGNGEDAYEHFKQYILLRDRLNSEDVKKAAMKQKIRDEFEKQEEGSRIAQEKKDILAKDEMQRQKILRNSFIGGFIIVMILVLVVFRGYRQKKKSNELLAEKNHEIEEKQKEILDSIRYARRIQSSLLPTHKYIDKVLTKHKK